MIIIIIISRSSSSTTTTTITIVRIVIRVIMISITPHYGCLHEGHHGPHVPRLEPDELLA